jgi:hypothetical protein
VHANLLIENAEPKQISYVGVLRHPEICRVTDVTEYARGIEPGQRLYCVQTVKPPPAPSDEERAANDVHRVLNDLGITPADTRLIDYRWNTYESRHIGDQCLTELEKKFAPAIRVLCTVDFAIAVSSYRRRWGALRQGAGIAADARDVTGRTP